jgi:6-phosphogluconolactonase (cycloisomerase 2 family)
MIAALGAGAAAAGLALAPGAQAAPEHPGSVFVQTNATSGNAVIVYARGEDGRLSEQGRYPTGGSGAVEPGAVVDPLASQGSLSYDPAHRLLYAVNAGSDSFTVFAVRGQHLRRVQVLPSGGHLPVSIGRSGDLVYVLDAGGDGAIAGYRVRDGRLHPIRDGVRDLGLGNPADPQFLASPSQVAVSPGRRAVIVATKTHDTLEVFPLDRAGRPAVAATVTATGGVVPFALTFDRAGRLQVADAAGGASSYVLHHDGALSLVSPFVANGQAATCWSAEAKGYLFTANAGSATITGYTVGRDGRLALRDPSGVTARTGAGPTDLAVSRDGNYLYQQASAAGAIDEFRVADDGALTLIGAVTGLPADGPEGIAAD